MLPFLLRFCFQTLLARCPKHIQSVFNLIVDILMDIHLMNNWQLSKGYPLTSVTWLYRQLKCTTHWDDMCLKVILWPVVGLIDRKLRFTIIINNLLTSSVRSLQENLRPRPWCTDLAIAPSVIARSIHIKASVWDFPAVTSHSVNK